MPKVIQVESKPEIDAVVELAFSIWNQHFVPIIGQDQVNYMLKKFQSFDSIRSQIKDGYEYYLLELENEFAGYIGLVPDKKKKKLMISKFYILNEHRGGGHGKYLLNLVKDICIKNEIFTIWLTVNRFNLNTINWYQRTGFEIVDEVKADIGGGFYMDDYIMELHL